MDCLLGKFLVGALTAVLADTLDEMGKKQGARTQQDRVDYSCADYHVTSDKTESMDTC